MEDERIQIDFHYKNEDGDEYSQQSNRPIHAEFDSELDVIGMQLNSFLKQMGYYRQNEYIFMKDVSGEEYELLEEYLNEIRNNKGK